MYGCWLGSSWQHSLQSARRSGSFTCPETASTGTAIGRIAWQLPATGKLLEPTGWSGRRARVPLAWRRPSSSTTEKHPKESELAGSWTSTGYPITSQIGRRRCSLIPDSSSGLSLPSPPSLSAPEAFPTYLFVFIDPRFDWNEFHRSCTEEMNWEKPT